MAALGSILTAVITPFDTDLRVDEAAFVRMLNYLDENGSDGVVVAGTTGEAPTLTDHEQLALIEIAVAEVGDRMTVVAGTGSNDTRHAVMLTERATELGVHATLSVTPYYNRPNRRGIIRHFEEVAHATDKPIILYNIPARTGTDMSNELLAELAQIANVNAIKQANPDNLALIDGLDLYAGDDNLLARVLDMGGAGGITVATHIVGPQMRAIVDEPERRAEIDADLHDVYEALAVTTNPIPIKAALKLLGLDNGVVRMPLVEASEPELTVIREMLEHHELLVTTAN